MTTNHFIADYLPRDAIKEIESLEPLSKALLLFELAEEILEATDGLFKLEVSATTTQNIKSLTPYPTCQVAEYLCQQLSTHQMQVAT